MSYALPNIKHIGTQMIHTNPSFDMTKIVPKEATSVLKWESEEWMRKEIMVMNDFLARTGAGRIVNTQQRLSLKYDLVLPMRSVYRNEDIHYSNPEERQEELLVFPYNGKLYDSSGKAITTTPLDFDTGAILVMSTEGVLFLSHKKRGVIHHSTLLAASQVAYACMLEVREGEIVSEKA